MTVPHSVPTQIKGFLVLPLSLPPQPAFPLEAFHYLYVSPHKPNIPSSTTSRSIFLTNIPVDSTETHLKALFSVQLGLPAGRIEKIEFEGDEPTISTTEGELAKRGNKNKKKRKRTSEAASAENLSALFPLPPLWDRPLHTSGSTAVLIFVDRPSMEAALKAAKMAIENKKYPKWGEGCEGKVPQLGLARYLKHQELTYPKKSSLLESVNGYMTAFAAREAEQAKLRARQRQEPDEEGFITVTRGGRNNPTTHEAAKAVAQKHKDRLKGLDDFYKFQARERKKARAHELLKNFEQDKERVRRLKERRKSFQYSPNELLLRMVTYDEDYSTPKPQNKTT